MSAARLLIELAHSGARSLSRLICSNDNNSPLIPTERKCWSARAAGPFASIGVVVCRPSSFVVWLIEWRHSFARPDAYSAAGFSFLHNGTQRHHPSIIVLISLSLAGAPYK
jgi:hypothetical protein